MTGLTCAGGFGIGAWIAGLTCVGEILPSLRSWGQPRLPCHSTAYWEKRCAALLFRRVSGILTGGSEEWRNVGLLG